MARKIKKKNTAQQVQNNQGKAPLKKESFFKKNQKIIIVVSSVLALALIAGIVFGIIALVRGNKEIDYLNDDLSQYVYISSDDYKNYPVNVPLVTVDESDVVLEINKLRVENKNKKALFDGQSVRPADYVIKLGDVVNIWYRGYTVDESGAKIDVSGTTNFKSSKPEALEIGSGKFVKGFEEALLGKPLQAKSLKTLSSGKVEEGDIIYISYKAFLASGAPTTVSNVIIDTSDKAAVDKIYGAGFADFFVGKTIGESKGETQAFRKEGDAVDTLYYELKIDYAVRSEVEPYAIEVVFPADYSEKSFRGLKVTFDVYVSTAVIYNAVPEWSDSFITETLKESSESLSAYAGETLTAKYENKIKAELEAQRDVINESLIEEEMWKHYHEKLKIKKLPEAEVEKIYLQYYGEALQYYNLYGESFENFDSFAKYYFNLSDNEKWRDYIDEKARISVTEKLAFYYIINKEGIAPDAAEYERLLAEIKEEYLRKFKELYKTELEACKTEEEKAAKLLEIEKRISEYYGEQYFNELVYYRYAMDFLIGFAEIK